MSTRPYVVGLLAPLLAVVAMNQLVDAGGIGKTAVVARVAAEQGPSDLVVSPFQLEHRAWVRTRLLMPSECPDVMVIGSSTVGGMKDGFLPGVKLRNAFLGGPTVEDFEAVTSVLRASSCRPKALVVGVDPWWLGNPALDERRWMAWVDDYLAYHERDSLAFRVSTRVTIAWSKVEERLNFTTTRESAKLLFGSLRGQVTLGPRLSHDTPEAFCASITSEHYVRTADGHYVSCPVQIPKPAERRAIAEGYLRGNMHSMGEWREVAHERLDRFERLVRAWGAEYGRVVLLGMPYNPITHTALRRDERVNRNLDELDARLARMQDEHVEFLSLRDAARVPCAEDEFEDSHHAAPACVAKVATALAERTRLLVPAGVPVPKASAH